MPATRRTRAQTAKGASAVSLDTILLASSIGAGAAAYFFLDAAPEVVTTSAQATFHGTLCRIIAATSTPSTRRMLHVNLHAGRHELYRRRRPDPHLRRQGAEVRAGAQAKSV